jgi:hypothetical protein
MMIRRSVWLLVGIIVVLSGCGEKPVAKPVANKTTLILGYTDLGTMAPVVKPGDVIEFQVAARWDPKDQSPCSNYHGNETTHCEIADKPKGKLYTFRCPYDDCDPEILVDDGTRVPPFTARTGAVEVNSGVNVPVRMVCDVKSTGGMTYAMKREPDGDIVAGPGKVVLFGVTGNYPKWHLEFSSGEQANMCQETGAISSDTGNRCTVKSSGATQAHFTIVIKDCDNPSDPITMKPS